MINRGSPRGSAAAWALFVVFLLSVATFAVSASLLTDEMASPHAEVAVLTTEPDSVTVVVQSLDSDGFRSSSAEYVAVSAVPENPEDTDCIVHDTECRLVAPGDRVTISGDAASSISVTAVGDGERVQIASQALDGA